MSVTEHGFSLNPASSGVASAAAEAVAPSAALAAELGLEARRRRHLHLLRWILLSADGVAFLGAFLATEVVTGASSGIAILTALALVLGSSVFGLYEESSHTAAGSTVDEIPRIFYVFTIAAWLSVALSWVTSAFSAAPRPVVTFWAFAIPAVVCSRAAARALVRQQGWCVHNALIVGGGDVGQSLARKILNHPEYGINLLGFVDASPKERREDIGELTMLGPISATEKIVSDLDIDRVFVAFSKDPHDEILDLTRTLKGCGVQVDIVPRLFEAIVPEVSIGSIEGIPVVVVPPISLAWWPRLLKRGVDLTGSLFGLLVLGPLLVLIALAIKLDSPGPIVFSQRRMGAGDRVFQIYKFRTMEVGADERKAALSELNKHGSDDARMFKAPDDPRVTRLGRFLRRFSLDELLQLINVFKGEMSLVGPRPLVLDEDAFVDEWARRRLSLRPGMTGLWQVLGRTDIPFGEMVRLDYLYVTNWTLRGDLRILARTLPAVLRRQDAY